MEMEIYKAFVKQNSPWLQTHWDTCFKPCAKQQNKINSEMVSRTQMKNSPIWIRPLMHVLMHYYESFDIHALEYLEIDRSITWPFTTHSCQKKKGGSARCENWQKSVFGEVFFPMMELFPEKHISFKAVFKPTVTQGKIKAFMEKIFMNFCSHGVIKSILAGLSIFCVC